MKMSKYSLFSLAMMPMILREGEGTGGGAGGEGGTVEAPWAGAEGVWTLGEGEAAKPWHTTIAEDSVRSHVEAKGYKNPAELAMANYQLNKLQRGDPTVIGMPDKDATPEQMSEFYGKLGRPDAPDGYEFKFGEDVKVDDGLMQFARTAFHEAGLTPAQAQAVADKWNEYSAQGSSTLQDQIAEQNTQELTALTEKWGADLEKNKAAGQLAVKALGADEALLSKVENQIGSAALVELMALIGRKSDEGTLTGGGGGGDPALPENMSKEQAQARIDELRGDEAFDKKYNDANHPEHKDAVAMLTRLYARI